MNIFKTFYKILIKHSASILIYVVIFSVICVIFTSLGSDNDQTTFKDSHVNIAVFNHDNNEVGNALYNYLDEHEDIIELKEDEDIIRDELFYRNVYYVLIIPEGFSDSLISGNNNVKLQNYKSQDSSQAYLCGNLIDSYLNKLNVYIDAGYSATDAIQLTNKSIDKTVEVSFLNGEKTVEKSSKFYFYQYLPYIFICILIECLGLILITFRKTDLNNRILCSSISLNSKNRQLIMGCISFALLLWMIFMAVGIITGNGDMFSISGLMMMLNSFIFLALSAGLAFFVSYLVNSPNGLNAFSNIFGLGFSFLGGIFVPLEIMSQNVKVLSKFIPTYWYISANNIAETYSNSNTEFIEYCKCIGIEVIFTIVFFLVAIVVSKLKSGKRA